MAGGTGDDMISGFGENDSLLDSAGRNALNGGAGSDRCERRLFNQVRRCP
jgi:hypothetical protein